MSRLRRALAMLISPASSCGTRRSVPSIDAIRSPSASPALSAGPPSVTLEMKMPSVSRLLPVGLSATPSTARLVMRSLSERSFSDMRSSGEPVLTRSVLTPPFVHTVSDTSSPGFTLASSRVRRRCIMPLSSGSPASSRSSLSETPLIDCRRCPSSRPAFSAGEFGVTDSMRRPSVSRLPPEPVAMPRKARSRSSEREKLKVLPGPPRMVTVRRGLDSTPTDWADRGPTVARPSVTRERDSARVRMVVHSWCGGRDPVGGFAGMDTEAGAEGCHSPLAGDATLPAVVLSEGGKPPLPAGRDDPGDA